MGLLLVGGSCGFLVECVDKRLLILMLIYLVDYNFFRKEVFMVPCPNNKRDKPTLEKIIVDKVYNL